MLNRDKLVFVPFWGSSFIYILYNKWQKYKNFSDSLIFQKPDKHGISPLLAAVWENHLEAVKLLLSKVSIINYSQISLLCTYNLLIERQSSFLKTQKKFLQLWEAASKSINTCDHYGIWACRLVRLNLA